MLPGSSLKDQVLHTVCTQFTNTGNLNKQTFCLLCVHVTLWFFYSDSVERADTLGDNSVQLQSFVQYEPDLFVSRYVCVQQSNVLAILNTFLYHPDSRKLGRCLKQE